MFFENLHHVTIAFTRCMNVLDWDVQNNKFIYEPRDIENTFILINRHEVIVFRVFLSKFSNQPVCSIYRLIHVVKTDITRYNYLTFYIKVQLKERRLTLYLQINIQVTTLHNVSIDGFEIFISKLEAKSVSSFLQAEQFYFKRF